MDKVKIAGIQMTCREDKKRNVEKAVRLIELAGERGAGIICLQELFSTVWFPKESDPANFELAETTDGETIRSLREAAKRTGSIIIAPFFEEGMDGVYYNSAAVIGEKGELIGTYRKTHIPNIPLYEEGYYFTGGDLGFPVFDTRFGKIGIQICWDNFYPEGARTLALKGAQLIFAPTAAAFASQERWLTVLAANAITNGVFVFRVNRVGDEERHSFYGQSFCLDPHGELIDKPSGTAEGIYEAEIDLRLVGRTRRDYPYLRYRRPELYGEIAGMKRVPDGKGNEESEQEREAE